MRHILTYTGFVLLLALVGASGLSAAQDEAQITVVGSGIGNALIEALLQPSATDMIELTTNGTTAGIRQFCGGDVDIVSTLRSLSAAEVADCISHEVEYGEFLIAHKIVALAAHNSVPATCISLNQLEAFVKPSASNQQLDWSEFSDEDDAPLFTLLLPASDTLEYAIVDELVAGDLLRRDAIVYADQSEAISRLAESEGALAVLGYSSLLASSEELKLLSIQDQNPDRELMACVEPSAESVESKRYSAAQSIYAYVNRERLDASDALMGLVQDLIDESRADSIVAAGFTAPSAERIAINSTVLTDPAASMASGDGETDFEIPDDLSGEINISGAANVYQLLKRTADDLTRRHDQLTVTITASDSEAAINDLCSGEVNIAMVDRRVEGDALQLCEDNPVTIVSMPIGTQAAVLLSNSADEFLQCLTLEQISMIWQASATESASSWADIDEAFPALEIVLFGASTGDRNADMLLARHGQAIPPIRRDTEKDFDPLYRGAAVGNVAGSLTYMSWQDYTKVVDNQQQNVRLVGVKADSGCVTPDEESIVAGAYALSRHASLLMDRAALAEANAQSLLWSTYADDNWSNFDGNGFVGMALADLAAHRRQLETHFRLAEADAAQAETTAETESADADDDGAD